MAPPRGPRGGGTRATRNNASTRPNRGGIQKRKQAGPKLDVDGDMDMDGEGRRRAKRPAAGEANNAKPTRSTRSSAAASTRLPGKQAEALVRHLNGNNSLASRASMPSKRGQQKTQPGLAWLSVKGLKDSKAASNPGGGVKDLIQFLERKATTMASRSSTRPIAIKQVSTPLHPEDFGGGSKAMPMVQTRLFVTSRTRATILTILAARASHRPSSPLYTKPPLPC